MELVEFLEARIAEDETAARAATAGPWGSEFGGVCLASSPYTTIAAVADLDLIGIEGYTYGPELQERANADHIARWDPARIAAECDAKRRIVEERCGQWNDIGYGPIIYATEYQNRDVVLRLLAMPYSSHADYDPEWKP